MSYVPTPPPPQEPVQEGGRPRDLWLGIVVGVLACVGLPFVGILLAEDLAVFGVGFVAPLLVLVVGIVLVIPDRTRRWGSGLLIGFCMSLVLGAGACVVLLASFGG